MPAARVFLDSNVLIYLRDASTPSKQHAASVWMHSLRAAGLEPILNWQALREFYSVVTRKSAIGLSKADARRDILAFRIWLAADPHDQIFDAWKIEDAYGFNFFDCLMLASAVNAGATHILTEDLQHGQLVESVQVVNPFLASFHDLRLV